MTVAELVLRLQRLDPKLRVLIQDDGDYFVPGVEVYELSYPVRSGAYESVIPPNTKVVIL